MEVSVTVCGSLAFDFLEDPDGGDQVVLRIHDRNHRRDVGVFVMREELHQLVEAALDILEPRPRDKR